MNHESWFSARVAKLISVCVALLVIVSILYFRHGSKKEEERAAVGGTVGRGASEHSQEASGSNKIYTNSEYHFSFPYPNEFVVHTLPEEQSGGDSIVLEQDSTQHEHATSPEEKPGMQIVVSPFDEEGKITRERILQDLPDMVIDDPKEAMVSKNQIPALIFFSQEESLGRTREVWFVHNAHLYQISARAQFDVWLSGILANVAFSE